ncbi:MAG: flagellar motor protein MotB [Nitrospinae bacterium]|nr:flagellar motor protein MotB [Nitrospinota bacterium]
MAKKVKQSELDDALTDGEASAIWLISLADMMSLLMTFFVMLFAMNPGKDESYRETLSKIGDALGGKSTVEKKSGLEDAQGKLESLVKEGNLVRQVQFTSDTRGMVMFAEGDLFFDPASAELKPEIRRFLRRIGDIIKETRYKVVVEGHTDDTTGPMTAFPTNWELSSARASSVVRYFVDEAGLEPYRFAAVGYAGFKPRYALTPENRPKNRRVEIVVLREKL